MQRFELLLTAVIGLSAVAIVATTHGALRAWSPTSPPAAGAPAPSRVQALPPAVAERAAAIPVSRPFVPRAESRRAPLPLSAAGMVLVAHPETGAPALARGSSGPALTLDELQALARQEAAGLATVRNPDGSEMIVHEGRFATHSIVRVGPDGKLVHGCVEGEGARDHALHSDPKAAPAAEDR